MKEKRLDTIEEFLHSRRHNPIFTLELGKDMARRIKKLERLNDRHKDTRHKETH